MPLVDQTAIRDLILAYARAVDRKDVAAVARCFTDDCAYEGMLARGTIRDMLAGLPAAMARYRATQHFMPHSAISVTGDRAHAETYTLAYHTRDDGGRLVLRTVAICYHDDLVRRSDGWRIAARRAERVFERTEDLIHG